MDKKEEIVKLAELMQEGELQRQRGRLDFTKHDFDTIVRIGQQRLDSSEFLIEHGYGRVDEVKKEKAKEILDEIWALVNRKNVVNFSTRVKEIASREGVELDE